VPSRLVNAIWLAWLAAAVALVGQAALPAPWQLAIIAAVLAITVIPIRRQVFLRGDRAVRALEWSAAEPGSYYVRLGPSARRLTASPGACQRYGPYLWVLRFETSEGLVQLLIDARRQDPRATRRLACRLFGTRANPGRSGRAPTAS
jgi:hypothetical protein